MVKKRITYASPLDALLAIAKRLGKYENKYGIDTEEFFYDYNQGKTSDDEDFIEWAGYYKHYLGLRREITEQRYFISQANHRTSPLRSAR